MISTYFHIHEPIWGVKQIYGWDNEVGIGLLRRKIDKLAQNDLTIIVRIGDDLQEYTIKARKVQEFPVHTKKKHLVRGQKEIEQDVITYVVKKSALNPRKPKTQAQIEKEEFIKYFV